jgi:V/A-type H+-transporting ATPase subunit I
MIVEMARVQVVGLKPHAEKVISSLHRFGGMQIDDIQDNPDVTVPAFTVSEKVRARHEEISLLIASINGLSDLFASLHKSAKSQPENPAVPAKVEYIHKQVSGLVEQVQYLNNRNKTLQDELVSLSRYISLLKAISDAVPETSVRSGNAALRALVPAAQMHHMQLLAQQLKMITRGKFELVTVKISESVNAMVGIFPLELTDQVETFIRNENITQLVLPEEYTYLQTGEALRHIQKKVEHNHQELDENDARLKRLAKTWLDRLHNWRMVCEDLLDELDAFGKLGETEYTFILMGWVPTEALDALRQMLESQYKDEVMAQVLDVPSEMQASIPVAMRNPAGLQSFEEFVRLRAVPRYSDIDPTFLMSVFMPLFFGMMVGDVGYGLLMLLISILVLRGREIKGLIGSFLKVLRFGAVWSILFGILFGEYFGTLGETLGIPPLWISRSEAGNIGTLIIMALAVGAGHILIGLAIGVWMAVVHRSRSEMMERFGMFLGLVGLILLAASLTQAIWHGFTPLGWAALIGGLIILSASFGKTGIFLGPLEFVGMIGNVLSYLRITALGLASVYLAKVANDMGGMLGSAAAGLVIALVIHSLNLVMGMLSPTIQSMRLQYVEFFRKFFEGGHKAFSPFSRRIPVPSVAPEEPKS